MDIKLKCIICNEYGADTQVKVLAFPHIKYVHKKCLDEVMNNMKWYGNYKSVSSNTESDDQ